MAYTEDTPQSSQTIAQTQPLILANFQGIKQLVDVNHVTFDDANEGKHKFLQMPEQSSAPTTAANEGGLYTKEASSVANLFFRRESDGDELQLTGAFTTGTTDGQFIIPGGLIVKWGLRSTIVGNATVTFGSAFPNNAYSVQISQVRNDTQTRVMYVRPSTLSVTGFSVRSTSGGGSGLYFIAIGD